MPGRVRRLTDVDEFGPGGQEALEETVAVLGDAGTPRRLADSDAELARGEEVSANQLAETIRARRTSAA